MMRTHVERCALTWKDAHSRGKMSTHAKRCAFPGQDAPSHEQMRPRRKRSCFKTVHAPSLKMMNVHMKRRTKKLNIYANTIRLFPTCFLLQFLLISHPDKQTQGFQLIQAQEDLKNCPRRQNYFTN